MSGAGVSVRRPRDGAVGRQITQAIRAGVEAAARAWHDDFMPKHFTAGAASMYGYAPRTAKYMRRKARKRGHQRALEYSGQSKDQAIHDYRVAGTTIAGQPAGVVTMQLPGYFVQHPHGGGAFIDKVAELTRTTPDEQRTLGDIVARVAAERLGAAVMPALAASA